MTRAGWLLAMGWMSLVGILALGTMAHGIGLGWEFLSGTMWGEPLLQYPDKHLTWSPYIHPPLYAEFLIVVWRLADYFDTDPQYYIYLYSAVLGGGLVFGSALWLRHHLSAVVGLLAAVLLATSPSALRPYEEYPLMKGLVLAVGLLAVGFVRNGGLPWGVPLVLLGLAAAELHLSAWFVIGPIFAGVFFTLPGRRREIAIASVAVIGLFLATTYPGLYEVLADGPDRPPDWITPSWRETISLEWTNPWLFAPLVLWLHPAVRAAAPGVHVLAFGAVGYTVITLGLQVAGLAIGGGGGEDAHHYFELIDGVLVVAAAGGLGAAAVAFPRARWGLSLAVIALTYTQVAALDAGRTLLSDLAIGAPL